MAAIGLKTQLDTLMEVSQTVTEHLHWNITNFLLNLFGQFVDSAEYCARRIVNLGSKIAPQKVITSRQIG